MATRNNLQTSNQSEPSDIMMVNRDFEKTFYSNQHRSSHRRRQKPMLRKLYIRALRYTELKMINSALNEI